MLLLSFTFMAALARRADPLIASARRDHFRDSSRMEMRPRRYTSPLKHQHTSWGCCDQFHGPPRNAQVSEPNKSRNQTLHSSLSGEVDNMAALLCLENPIPVHAPDPCSPPPHSCSCGMSGTAGGGTRSRVMEMRRVLFFCKLYLSLFICLRLCLRSSE